MAASRRAVDFLWILMAALGLLALLPVGLESKSLDPSGVVYGLAAGVCWALYIFFGRKAGAAHGGQTTALGMVVGAIVIVPIGAVQVVRNSFRRRFCPLRSAWLCCRARFPIRSRCWRCRGCRREPSASS